jgi:drug/metabolite transporter (DMT)-like permease
MDKPRYTQAACTGMGLAAIVLWSTTIAVSRSLAESLGALPAGAIMWLAGGVLGCLYAALVRRNLAGLLRLPPAYLLGCGSCFVAYMVCLYLALGLADSRQQTLEVGILNYLWPALTLVLSVPILGVRVRPVFWLGVIVALAGAVLAPLHGEGYSAEALLAGLRGNPWPYVLAAAAGVLWALYSVLSRRWGGAAETGGVPLFALASGLVLGGLGLLRPEPAHWTWRAGAELTFMAVLTVLVAYSFWDAAMRRGNATRVATASYAIPVLSTAASCLYLSVTPGATLWLACGLVAAGALVCHFSTRPVPPKRSCTPD